VFVVSHPVLITYKNCF